MHVPGMQDLPPFETHEVGNQPPPFEPRDLWADDIALRDGVAAAGASMHAAALQAYGRLAGDELYRLGFDANRDRPRLRTHDRYGHRIDTVEFHPAYHRLMEQAKAHGVAGLSRQPPRPGAHVARAALSYLHHQGRSRNQLPADHDPRRGAGAASRTVIKRMGRQGGRSALRPARRRHRRQGRDHPRHGHDREAGRLGRARQRDHRDAVARQRCLGALVGHKWFLSAPMSDGFPVLAQAPAGLSCFLMPRRLPDGTKNAFRLMRLKDKLGDWANASSEVELCGAQAWRVGEEGRGVATIIEMVMLTRLDCMLGAAAETRMALAQALHHARHRVAFGRPLVAHPLMANVLADLAIESEAATAFALHVAAAVDAAPADPQAAAYARVATAIGKYWLCRRAPALVNEAQECPGRRRLRRGIDPAAAVPAGAAEFDLGGQRQHPVPGRAARAGARTGRGPRVARGAARCLGPASVAGARSRPARTPVVGGRRARAAGARAGRAAGTGAAGFGAAGRRQSAGGGLPAQPPGRRTWPYCWARCRPGSTSSPSSTAPCPPRRRAAATAAAAACSRGGAQSRNCSRASSAYRPPCASSCAWVPSATIRPASITTIRSARSTVAGGGVRRPAWCARASGFPAPAAPRARSARRARWWPRPGAAPARP